MRRAVVTALQVLAAAVLVGGCATSGRAGALHAGIPAALSSPNSGGAAAPSGPPCLLPDVRLVVDSVVIDATGLPMALHGPFSNVGVQFGAADPGIKLVNARLDVLSRSGAQTALENAPAAPSAAANEQRQLIGGTEAGVVARSQITMLPSGPFLVSLGTVNTALHLSGPVNTAALRAIPAPTGYASPFAPYPAAAPTPAGGYEAYLITHYQGPSCSTPNSSMGPAQDTYGVIDLATLLP